MYTGYYNLSVRPFESSSDPEHLWLGEKQSRLLSKLEMVLKEGKSSVLLVGEEGSGKSTLIQAFLDSLEPGILSARIAEPGTQPLEFLNRLAGGFNLGEFAGEEEFLIRFKKFLREAHRSDRRVLLIVDDAHTLTEEIIEQIRLLSNIELPEKKLIRIFLVGRNTLEEKLKSPSCRALAERIEMRLRLPSLSKGEAAEYIRHRLKAAGGGPEIFTEKALRKIERISSGNLRLVGTLCDRALLKGQEKELQTISPQIINQIIKESRKDILPRRFRIPGSIALRRRMKGSNSAGATRKRIRNRPKAKSTSVRWAVASGTLVLLIALFLPIIGSMPAFDWFGLTATRTRETVLRHPVENPPNPRGLSGRPSGSPSGTIDRQTAQGTVHGFFEERGAAAPERFATADPAVPAAPVAADPGIGPVQSPVQRPTQAPSQAPTLGTYKVGTPPEVLTDRIQTEVLPYFHRVQWAGETLSLISEWYTGSAYNWRGIAEANPGIDPHRIHLGDEIFIPYYLMKVKARMPADYRSSAAR